VPESKKVENTNAHFEMWKTALDMGIYKKSMVLEEIRNKRDELAIGDSVTEEMIEQMRLEEGLEKNSEPTTEEENGEELLPPIE
jgi:hypothetical protein